MVADNLASYSNKEINTNHDTNLISTNRNSLLLQTIPVEAADVKEEKKRISVNVIFDGGSQRTYFSQRFEF